jgi:hypothetical protein
MRSLTGYPRLAAILSSTRTTRWGWQIQVDVNRQRLTIKIINDIERTKTATANQRVVHEIN